MTGSKGRRGWKQDDNEDDVMILAIETATEVCSVALRLRNGSVDERRVVGRGVHSEKLFLFMDELLTLHRVEPGGLKELLISSGPGHYTGLRIGASGVKGFLFGTDLPLYTLGTLEGFAAGVIPENPRESFILHAVIDARRNHLYHQRFSYQDGRLEHGEAAVRELPLIEHQLNPGESIVGTGLERLSLPGPMNLVGTEGLSAVHLIRARLHPLFRERFRKTDPESFQPEYLSGGQVNNSPEA